MRWQRFEFHWQFFGSSSSRNSPPRSASGASAVFRSGYFIELLCTYCLIHFTLLPCYVIYIFSRI